METCIICFVCCVWNISKVIIIQFNIFGFPFPTFKFSDNCNYYDVDEEKKYLQDRNSGKFSFLHSLFRSNHQRCSIKKGVLRNFEKITGKHLCQRLLFNKVAGLRPTTSLKNRLWHGYFLKTPFLQNTSGRLLLIIETLV